MEIKQKTYLEVKKDDKLVQLVVDQSMPLGVLFDCLMELKGYVCDRMAKSHKDEQEEAEKKMSPEEEEPEE